MPIKIEFHNYLCYAVFEVNDVLIEFSFKNFRSFRDEAILSMEAAGLGARKSCLIEFKNYKLLPAAAIFGKNGGGKSNVIRAFWLAVQFIRNAQRTQHENAEVPVIPFLLDDFSYSKPTEFHFIYSVDGIKYWYGFSATKKKIVTEYLYHAPNGQKALVFERSETYTFTEDKAKRTLISKTVAANQLFFSMACTMNDNACIQAMRWFREYVLFSRDYADIPSQIIENFEDKSMLQAVSNYAVAADVGIESMRFEVNSAEIDSENELPDDMPEPLRKAFIQFMQVLSENTNDAETRLKMGQLSAKAAHRGTSQKGKQGLYELDLADESDGTRKLMALAPAIESALRKGGVLLVDEIERELHPILVNLIISKFQSKRTNPNGAQIIFTTHNVELMNLELLRKDQIYLVDKKQEDGASDLYSISDFTTRTTDNIRKGYFIGKFGAVPDVEIEEVE